MKRSTIWAAVTILMITGPLSAQTKRTQPAAKRTGIGIPSSFPFSGWVLNGTPRKLSGKALAEYLAGRGATALQYGVKDLSVHRFKPSSRTKRTPGREFTLEVFRMDSAADAFGLFSFERRSTEAALPAVAVPNAIGSDRAVLAKGYAYLEIRAKGCERAEIEKLAAAAARRIGLPFEPPPPGIVRLPRTNLVPGSERYIKGDIAAGAETPFLNRDFWGFRAGTSRGYAARYAPGDSKLIVVEFAEAPEGLTGHALALFKEYLEDVREGDGLVVGSDVSGGACLFRLSGKIAVLIIGEPDRATADARLLEVLAEFADPD